MKTDDNLSPFFKINYFLDINKSQDFNTQSIKILLGQIPNIDFAIGFLGGSDSKESAYSVGELCQEDPMEKGMAMHAGIPA